METRPTKAWLILTGVIFAILAVLLAANFTPGKDPVMRRVTMVALWPTIPMVQAVVATGLWTFSGKADLAFAVLLGGLTLLTAFLYAGILVLGANLIKGLREDTEPTPGHVAPRAATDSVP